MGGFCPDSLTAMTKDSDIPSTQAVRMLRDQRVEFTAHVYDYVERGGTAHSSIALAVDEHFVACPRSRNDGMYPLESGRRRTGQYG